MERQPARVWAIALDTIRYLKSVPVGVEAHHSLVASWRIEAQIPVVVGGPTTDPIMRFERHIKHLARRVP